LTFSTKERNAMQDTAAWLYGGSNELFPGLT
jgi:hypothetical protein